METLHIIGGGLAGSEAAWQAAQQGIPVVIHEMRPHVETFAHKTGDLAEMVCSNSFRSDDSEQNAVGLLHWEMRAAGGLIMEMADANRLPAGGALAVDREAFSAPVCPTMATGSSPPARSPLRHSARRFRLKPAPIVWRFSMPSPPSFMPIAST